MADSKTPLPALAQLQAALARCNGKIAEVLKAASDAITEVSNAKADKNHTHTKAQVGLDKVDNTADADKTVKAAATADMAKKTYINVYKTVDLTALDGTTWYPVVGGGIPYSGYRRIQCDVQLNSGSKPSWSTHSSGFTAVVDILDTSCGWGTTTGYGIILQNDQKFYSGSPPVGYSQMRNASCPVFWLRGGAKYRLCADYDCSWSIKTATFTSSSQSVSPTTTYPGVYVARSTITANLSGNASTATTASTASAAPWSGITDKPTTYPPATHTHDLSAMINTLTTGTAAPTDADYYVCQYSGGGTTTTSYHRRPVSALWNYIKGKADSVYQAKGSYAAAVAPKTLTIPVSGWSTDSTAGYPNYVDVSVSGLTANDTVCCIIAPASASAADAAQLCGACESLAGKLRIRAKSVPAAALTATWYIVR